MGCIQLSDESCSQRSMKYYFLFVCSFISIKMLHHVSLRLVKISSINKTGDANEKKTQWWFLCAFARTTDQGHNRVAFSKWNEHLARTAWQFLWRQDRQIAHIPIDMWNEGGWNWRRARVCVWQFHRVLCRDLMQHKIDNELDDLTMNATF